MEGNPAVLEEDAPPVQEQEALVQERDAPVREQEALVREQEALVQERDAPDLEHEAPGREEDAPVVEQDVPVPVLHPVLPEPAMLARKRAIKLKVLPVVTVLLLCAILIGELTPDYTLWMHQLAMMDRSAWTGTLFVGIGDITALLLIYSPLDTIFDVLIEGSVGRRLQEPFVAALCNCIIWCLYGLYGAKTINYSVLIINGAGAVFYLGYTSVMVRNGHSIAFGVVRVVAGAVLASLITAAFTMAGCWYGVSYGCDKAAIIGWSGASLSCIMYLVPALQNFYNVQQMNLQMVFASMLNASVWSAYGFTIDDIRMWFPSITGFILCFIQLLVYYIRKWRVQGPQRERPENEQLLHAV